MWLQDGTITPSLAQTVLTTFDKCINRALSQRVKNKVNFKVGSLSFIFNTVKILLRDDSR